MKPCLIVRAIRLLGAALLLWAGSTNTVLSQATDTAIPATGKFDLAEYKGHVVLLAIGSVENKESVKAMETLAEFCATAPKGVAAVYIDIGKTDDTLAGVMVRVAPTYKIVRDPENRIAERISFESIPTYCLFCKWGQLRFKGPWDAEAMRQRIDKLLAEKAPQKENYFMEMQLGKGRQAPDFQTTCVDGTSVTLSDCLNVSRSLLLVFGRASSPASQVVFSRLNALGQIYEEKGLSIVAIHVGKYEGEDETFYQSLALECPLSADESGRLASLYRVESVPTAFLIEKTGRIFLAGAYTPAFEENMQTYLRLGPTDTSSWNLGAMLNDGGSRQVVSGQRPVQKKQAPQASSRGRRRSVSSPAKTSTNSFKPLSFTPRKTSGGKG